MDEGLLYPRRTVAAGIHAQAGYRYSASLIAIGGALTLLAGFDVVIVEMAHSAIVW